MEKLIEKPTQCNRILAVLKRADGEWVSGRHFLLGMLLSQYHARIFELQKKGHKIEASDFTDEYGYKSYRITKDTLF